MRAADGSLRLAAADALVRFQSSGLEPGRIMAGNVRENELERSKWRNTSSKEIE